MDKLLTRRKIRHDSPLLAFGLKLVDKILMADSNLSIERYINAALRAMQDRSINGYIIQRFIEKIASYLSGRDHENISQKMNTAFALKLLQQWKERLNGID